MTPTIPGVRDQLKSWSGRRSTKDAAPPQRETLDVRNLKILGSVARSTFATTPDGRELRLKGPAMPHAIEEAAADAVLVRQPVRAADGRQQLATFIGSQVQAGTFAALKKRKSYTPREWRPGAIDRDDELRREEPRQWVALGKDGGGPLDVIRGAMTTTKPDVLVTDGRPPLRSVADELAFLKRSGIALALSADGAYLLVTTTKALGAVQRAMLDNRSSLYFGHLKAEPVRCAWPHKGETPEAITVAVGNAPVCGEHLAGRA